jgi:hypothetical protein
MQQRSALNGKIGASNGDLAISLEQITGGLFSPGLIGTIIVNQGVAIVKWRLYPGQGHAIQHQRGIDGCLKGKKLVEDKDAQLVLSVAHVAGDVLVGADQ